MKLFVLFLLGAVLTTMVFGDRFLLVRTPSVAVGLYRAVDPAEATHVTFCLPELPDGIVAPSHLCQPGNPGGRLVAKRVRANPDGTLELCGRGERPLDSSVLGMIDPALVAQYYRSVMTWPIQTEWSCTSDGL